MCNRRTQRRWKRSGAGAVATRVGRISYAHRAGFTLVELLVVIGIVAVMLAILLPSLIAARKSSRATQCAANVRSVCQALLAYASDHRGAFPPNIDMPSAGPYWYEQDCVGKYFSGLDRPNNALTCPEDPDARRSYAMNIWASGDVDVWALKQMKDQGVRWSASAKRGSQLMLVCEAWSAFGSDDTGWYANATVGLVGKTPGQRFGAGGGITPPVYAGRWGEVRCELPYVRHRRSRGAGETAPVGQVNIGYADGHVAAKSEWELADFQTGHSRLDSLWSPDDPELNQ